MTRLLMVLSLASVVACSDGVLEPTRTAQTDRRVAVVATTPDPVPPAPRVYTCAERDAEVAAYIASRGNAFDTAMITLSSGEVVYIEWQFDPAVPRRVHHVSGPVCQ